MLNVLARVHVNRVTEPIGRWLVTHGIAPDVVTVAGTVGSSAAAIWFLPRDELFVGAVVITLFVLFDLVDGAMARARGHSTPFGAVLDSTCDRVADGALFAGAHVVVPRGGRGAHARRRRPDCAWWQASSSPTSRPAPKGAGLSADGGLVERAERLIIALVGTGLHGLGVPYALHVALWLLAAASVWTVGQRIVAVYRSAQAADPRRTRSIRPRAREHARRALRRRRVRGGVAAGARGCLPRWPAARSGSAPTSAPAAPARAPGGCAPTSPGSFRTPRPAELDALVRAGLRSYARYWCEMFRLRAGDGPRVRAYMDGT